MAAFYNLAECARLLREPRETVREWTLKGLAPTRRPGQQLSPPAYGFDDFISLYVVSELRRRGIRLQAIRTAEAWLRESFGYPRPLATARLFTAGKNILVEMAAQEIAPVGVRESELVAWGEPDRGHAWTAANRGGQQAIEEAFRAVLEAVEYGEELATTWRPWPDVEMSARRQFGAPCVAGTGIHTATIFRFIQAGDDPEQISRLYDLPPEQVESAVAWEKSLDRAA